MHLKYFLFLPYNISFLKVLINSFEIHIQNGFLLWVAINFNIFIFYIIKFIYVLYLIFTKNKVNKNY